MRSLFAAAILFFVTACSTLPSRIEPLEARTRVAEGALLVDVRGLEEFASGHVDGALNIPHDQVERRLSEFGEDKNREVVLYCGSGRRAGLAQETLKSHGFTRVYNSGGYDSWRALK